MTDLFKTIGDGMNQLTKSTMREFDNIAKTTDKNIKGDFAQMDKGLKNGGFLGFAVEAADVFSPGHQAANALENFHIIGDDPLLKEGISAGVNIGAGFIIGSAVTVATGGTAGPFVLAGLALGAKDIADMMSVPGTPMAPAHSTATPAEELKSKSSGMTREQATEAAKHKSIEKREAYESARADAIGLAKEKAIARRDGYAAGYDSGFRVGYDSGYADALKRMEDLYGKDKTDKVESEIDKILSNPNLCFEDMIFALLRAVIKEGQGDVKEMAKDLKNGRLEEGELKKDFKKAIDDKTLEIKNEKDPAKKNELQNELQNLREERAEKLSERSESRSEVAEDLKNLMSKLSEMQQALSNILNTQHEGAMSAIRNIK